MKLLDGTDDPQKTKDWRTMKENLSKGMQALQDRVAEKIIQASGPVRKPPKVSFLLKMRPEFKLALMRESQRTGESMSFLLLEAFAEKISWKGRF